MGYDFHITRASAWTESESVPISLDEWKKFVASHAEFRMDDFAAVTTPAGETIRYENEGLALWTCHSENVPVWFDYRRGRIVVKNADEKVLEKMREVARYFGARIVGDDGEQY